MAIGRKRRHDREGSVFKRTSNGVFKDFCAVIPIYDPITDELVKRVYGYGATADIAVKRRNAKAYKLMRSLGTLSHETRTKLDADIDDTRERESNITLGVFAQQWVRQLDETARRGDGSIREATISTYRSHIDLHIVRHLGDYRLNQLTNNLLTDFLNITLRNTPSNTNRSATPAQLRKQGKLTLTDEEYYARQPKLSGKTIKHIKTTLNQILNHAVKRNLLPSNPMDGVEFRQEVKTRRETKVSWGEQILQKLPSLYADNVEEQLRWHLGVITGLRQSEALGLTDDRFMLNHPVPHLIVSQTLSLDTQTHGCGERHADGNFPCKQRFAHKCPQKQRTGLPFLTPFTKTSSSKQDGVRRIPLPASTLALVKKHLTNLKTARTQYVPQPYIGKGIDKMGELIFTTNNGQPRRPKYDNARWHSLIQSINANLPKTAEPIPAIRQHTTRRICATILARQGINIELAKQILGHSDELMTEYYITRNLADLHEPLRQIDHALHTGDSSTYERSGLTTAPEPVSFNATVDQIRELAEADKDDTANLPEG